jgi:rhodanese-related sulfurtransferase
MGSKKNIFATLCSLFLLSACNTKSGQTNLSVTEFEKAIADSNIQLLDVRTADEYASGHLENALLADWNNEEVFKTRVAALDKEKKLYTYCLSGGRSAAATEWLNQNGFIAFNLSGGMIAWKAANKPLAQEVLVRQLTLEEYMAQIPKDKTVLVDFSAVWCPPCKKMAPLVDSLFLKNSHLFTLVKIDGGQQTNISKELKIEEFPTYIIYKMGKETWRKQGLTDIKEFESNL